MRVWHSFHDVGKAVLTITATMRETGSLPAVLVDAYRETLATSTKGMVQKFFEGLAESCPEALKYFSDRWLLETSEKTTE